MKVQIKLRFFGTKQPKLPPTVCTACALTLEWEEDPWSHKRALYCPMASLAFGAKMRNGYPVVECDY